MDRQKTGRPSCNPFVLLSSCREWITLKKLDKSSCDDCLAVTPASPHRKKIQRGPGGNRRNSSQSEPSSEADSAMDSPLSEPLNVDVS
jgi:hypothetical protein